MRELGTWLARLGGADVGVLEKARTANQHRPSKEKSRYLALGLVLLATASLAVLSMTFAMIDGLRLPGAASVLMGLAWGAVILTVDRALILNLKPKAGRLRLAGMILPRLLMATLLGLVIATPLTLRMFDSEIEAQMVKDNLARTEQNARVLASGNQQERLDRLKAEIQHHEDILAGRVTFSSPALKQAEDEYEQAEADYQAKQATAETARRAWRCELDGDLCDGGSGGAGNGPRAQALKLEYDRKQRDANVAAQLRLQKLRALETLRAQNMSDNGTKLAEAQAEANRVLPGLRKQRDELQAAMAGWLGQSNDRATNDTGLLARLVALDHLGDDNGWARLAHLLVAGLLFMLELLPVAIKSMTIMGPPTLYDQLDDLDNKQVIEDATQQRSQTRRKRKEIDEDMYDREMMIARQVNNKVADVVREIAMEQVDDWGRRVRQTAKAFAEQQQNGDHGAQAVPDDPQIAQPSHNGGAQPARIPNQRVDWRARVARWLYLPPSKHTP